MTIEELLAGESKNLEFKENLPEKSNKYMKTVVAFANGAGGKILFGIRDKDQSVVGVQSEAIFQTVDAITNAISDSCEPIIVPDVTLQTIEGKTIIVVEITAGQQRPYYIKSQGMEAGTYIRVSGTTRPAEKEQIKEMFYESAGHSYDCVPRKDLEITEEDIQSLCRAMKEVALANCKNDVQRAAVKDATSNVLLSWGILAEENGKLYPTNAYVFLLGLDDFLSRIQCGVFKGSTRAIFVDRREYRGALWEQVEEAYQFILRNIHLGAKIEGIYRKDMYEIPPESIRELIINAAVHCSFLQSSLIQVAIFDDRLEITSPGGLLPGVTLEKMREGYSKVRNHAIASAFSYMNIMEQWGSGIPKIISEVVDYGLREPEFVDMESALRIKIYRNLLGNCDTDMATQTTQGTTQATQDTTQATTQGTTQATQDTTQATQGTTQATQGTTQATQDTTQVIREDLSDEDKAILQVIFRDPYITQKEMAEELGWKVDLVKYYVNKLKMNLALERVGSSQKGHWEILLETELWRD